MPTVQPHHAGPLAGQIRYRIFAVLLLAVLIPACSMTRLGYNMAPTLVDWRISRYVTFNAGQQEIVDKSLAALHEWHRTTQLPVYARFLDSVSDRLSRTSDRLEPAELAAWREQARQAWRELIPALAGPTARIALTLTPAQIDEIEAAMAQQNSKRRNALKRLTGGQSGQAAHERARRERRLARWTERAEWALGELSLAQQALLERRVKTAPDSSGWWQRRSRQQQELISLLRTIQRTQPSEAWATKRITQWLTNYGQPATPSAREASERLLAYADDTMVQLLALAPDWQIDALRDRVDGFRSDLHGLLLAAR